MRLFVAIPLPFDLRERLSRLEGGLPGARWVSEDNLHLTLRFLGEVDGRQAHDIDAALSRIRMPAFALQLSGIDCFGEGSKVHSLWVGVERNAELMRLREKVENACQAAGMPPDRRKFKPHITLARFKQHPGPKLQDFMTRHNLLRPPPFSVDRFALFSSFLQHSGAIYSEEAEYPLDHGAVGVGW
ncbi:MAG: RNA 2',3'-cyclic phosphodiesterase [Rhodovibrionaceae bacterium]|nr:RNA 2',3'-cyclic phosphodiesterase [Rhodovibrionaceae bacterium]